MGKFHHNFIFSSLYSLSVCLLFLLVCKLKNLGLWLYQLMIHFIVVFSFFLQDYISHLTVGLFLLSLLFWGCSFPFKISYFVNLRVLEIHLFYNLQLFYWHFVEILWLFIFLVFYC